MDNPEPKARLYSRTKTHKQSMQTGEAHKQSMQTGEAHNKSIETSETTPDLPAIYHTQHSTLKANILRNQASVAKQQLLEMHSKLKQLRLTKEKYEAQQQDNLTKLHFLKTVKQRALNDHDYKERLWQIKNQSLQELKSQVAGLRETLVRERTAAQDHLLQTRVDAAEQQRRRQKHHEYLIRKLKQLEELQNSRKVEKVKQLQEQSASRARDFQTSRLNFSKDNYHQKVLSALKDRDAAARALSLMREEEQSLRNLVMQSQKQMLASLYTLQAANPQRRSSFNETRRTQKSLKIDLGNFHTEEFET